MDRLILVSVLLVAGCKYKTCQGWNVEDTQQAMAGLQSKETSHIEVAPMPRPVGQAPRNALVELAGNGFHLWNLTGRVEMQFPKTLEVAPMPRALD